MEENQEQQPRRDALAELEARIDAAIEEVRPKVKRAMEELDARVDAAVTELRPRVDTAMEDIRPRLDRFVADVQPRLDSMLERIQTKIAALRSDLETRARRGEAERETPKALPRTDEAGTGPGDYEAEDETAGPGGPGTL